MTKYVFQKSVLKSYFRIPNSKLHDVFLKLVHILFKIFVQTHLIIFFHYNYLEARPGFPFFPGGEGGKVTKPIAIVDTSVQMYD